MEKVSKHGLMVQNTRDLINKDKEMVLLSNFKEKEYLIGLTDLNLKVSLVKIIFREMEYILGKMVENMTENGKKIKCTVMAILHGLMEKGIYKYISYKIDHLYYVIKYINFLTFMIINYV